MSGAGDHVRSAALVETSYGEVAIPYAAGEQATAERSAGSGTGDGRVKDPPDVGAISRRATVPPMACAWRLRAEYERIPAPLLCRLADSLAYAA
jgi:hypothetical protein